MTLPDEMRRLTQHFLDAYDVRMVAVADMRAQAAEDARERMEYVDELRSDTAAFLKELDANHQDMAAELRAHLDEQELARQAQATEDTQGRADDRDRLASETAAFMEETHAANRQMAAELRAHLADQESARLAQAAEDARERAEYDAARRAQAAEDAQGRMEYVTALKSDTAVFLQELDADHQDMAAELRAHLDEQESARLAQAAEDARERAEYDAARRAQAAEDAQERMEYVDNLRDSVANLLKELDAAHQAMAAELRAHLDEQESARQAQAAEDAQERVEYVATLKSDTAALLKELDADHQDMAAELRARLDEQESARLTQAVEDAQERAEYVDTLKSDTSAMLNDFQAEFDEARRVWSSFTTLMQQRRAKKVVAPPPPPPPVKKVVVAPPPVEVAPPPPVVEAPPVEEVAPDDLTTIRGIGATTQARLNELGIMTYAQLTGASPDELRPRFGRLANVEEWIEQARELALG